MTILLIDPLALWRGLHPAAQEQIGALCIANILAIEGACGGPPEADENTTAFERTESATNAELDALIAETFPDLFDDRGLPTVRPDLNALGIRQCTACGCTDENACTPPCAWAGPTLCTTCLPPAKEA